MISDFHKLYAMECSFFLAIGSVNVFTSDYGVEIPVRIGQMNAGLLYSVKPSKWCRTVRSGSCK